MKLFLLFPVKQKVIKSGMAHISINIVHNTERKISYMEIITLIKHHGLDLLFIFVIRMKDQKMENHVNQEIKLKNISKRPLYH